VPTTDATPCPNPSTGAPTPVAPRPSERRHSVTPPLDAGAVATPMPRASSCTEPKERGGKPVTLLTVTRSHHWLRSMLAATRRRERDSEIRAAPSSQPHRMRDPFFLGGTAPDPGHSRFYLRKGTGDAHLRGNPEIGGPSGLTRGAAGPTGRADGEGRPERGATVRRPVASGAVGVGIAPIRGADGR
jgi:hypothetical protein